MTNASTQSLHTFSIGSTLLDATVEFARGNRKSSALLFGAAALSTRISGLGTAASVLLRVVRRLR